MSNKTVLLTGDRGFIGTYIVQKLLDDGHEVVGIDNDSKYGEQQKAYDGHTNYTRIAADCRDEHLLKEVMHDYGVSHMIMGAALIGGIPYFHQYPYTLLAKNEQLMAAQFNAAIHAYENSDLTKVLVISSSMVYEGATKWPSVEGDELISPPPHSSYGFQKLATEYFARAAWDEFKLPYTIVRPFNCVGIGERRSQMDPGMVSGNIALAMSHVVPDLIQKLAKGQYPLRILGDGSQVRHYTYGADLADGIVTALFHPNARNQDFNLSSPEATTVMELAEKIWEWYYPYIPMSVAHDEPFFYDVQRRSPDTTKAERLLGWKAITTLDEMLKIVIPWVDQQVIEGGI